MGLGTDLTLLAIDAEPGYLRVGSTLPYSLVVGELVDLAAAGRITLRGELIEVLDRSPIGETLADDSLARLADIGAGQSVEQWLELHGHWRVEAYLAGLRYQHVLRDSSVRVVASGRIDIADTLRAAAPVQRLRMLIADERAPSSVQDLAFVVLADSTGWPQVHLRLHRDRRARLKRLATSVAGSADFAGLEADAAFAVLRHGVRAAAKLARQSRATPEYIADHGNGTSRSRGYGGLMNRRGLRIVTDVVGLLALATLVLACLTNVALAIIIAPFTIALAALPVAVYAERREGRRKLVDSDRASDVSSAGRGESGEVDGE
jgi:hypothetical protein